MNVEGLQVTRIRNSTLPNGVRVFPLAAEYAEGLRLLRNLDHVRFGFRGTDIVTKEQQCVWLASYQANSDDHLWVGVDRTGTVVAAAALYDLDPGARDAQLGRVMFDTTRTDLRGTGSMLVAYVTEQGPSLGLRRVWLFVKTENHKAITAYVRAGFSSSDERSEDGMLFMVKEFGS